MQIKKICDSHLHSCCSFDAHDSVDEMCKRAIALGLYAITITDHFEANLYYDADKSKFGDFSVLIPRSIKEIKSAQQKYSDKIKIYCGIELGEPLQDKKATAEILSLTDYDFILGSLHNISRYDDFFFLEYTEENVKEILNAYFAELLQMVRFGGFDSLAHITYPLRYISGRSKIAVDLNEYSTQIDAILKTLIEKNLAMEVNSSGLRQEIGKTLPDKNLIMRYKELGGKYVTVGSDAHCTKDMASGIEQTYSILKECGFKYYTVFEKRVPILIEL